MQNRTPALVPLHLAGVPNGYIVDEFVWRSGQPDDEAWIRLAQPGAVGPRPCAAVLDLNTPKEGVEQQAVLIARADMIAAFFHLDPVLPPSLSRIEAILAQIDAWIAAGLWPILVKCKEGSDRTGATIACWRMHHDGWDCDDALEEAVLALKLRGMHELWMSAVVLQWAKAHGKM